MSTKPPMPGTDPAERSGREPGGGASAESGARARLGTFVRAAALLAALPGAAAMAQTPLPDLKPQLPSPKILPDLTVTQIDFVNGVFHDGPCNRVAITIRNSGHAVAPGPIAVRLRLTITGAEAARSIDQPYPGRLDPGASAVVFFDAYDVTQLARSGAVEIRSTVDVSNTIVELDEGNNTRQVPPQTLASGSNCPVLRLIPGIGVEGAPVPIGIQVDRSFPRTIQVQWRVQQGAAIAGAQCGGGADFVLASGTVSFTANATDLLRTVYIQTCRDTQREIDEPLSLRVTGSRNVKLPAQPFVTGVVRDNQAPN